MHSTTHLRSALVFTPLLTLAFAGVAGAQTTPSGQATPPGTQMRTDRTACSQDVNGAPTNASEPGCYALTPGFNSPSLNMPRKLPPRDITSVVKVEGVVAKPAGPMPENQEITVEGNTTVIKAKMVRLGACFSSGKRWSANSGQPTSTTCMDKKGGVIALQECKPADGETPMTCSVVFPRQESAKN